MVAVPAALPVTLPDPTVAFVFDELQTPPGTASESKVVDPAHTVVIPDIVPVPGARPTVTTAVAETEPHELIAV